MKVETKPVRNAQVLSIPHSGTHFAQEALAVLQPEGSGPINYTHVNIQSPVHLARGGKFIIPVRHPYRVLMSHYSRNDSIRFAGLEVYPAIVANYFRCLGHCIEFMHGKGIPYAMLPIDKAPENRVADLTLVGRVLFDWPLDKTIELPSDFSRDVVHWVQSWPVTSWSEWLQPPEFPNLSALDFALEWLDYPKIEPSKILHMMGAPEAEAHKHMGFGAEALLPKVHIKGEARVIKRGDPNHPANKAAAARG